MLVEISKTHGNPVSNTKAHKGNQLLIKRIEVQVCDQVSWEVGQVD